MSLNFNFPRKRNTFETGLLVASFENKEHFGSIPRLARPQMKRWDVRTARKEIGAICSLSYGVRYWGKRPSGEARENQLKWSHWHQPVITVKIKRCRRPIAPRARFMRLTMMATGFGTLERGRRSISVTGAEPSRASPPDSGWLAPLPRLLAWICQSIADSRSKTYLARGGLPDGQTA